MQPFHKESNWTEKKRSTQDQSIVVQIKERILRVLSENEQDITEEDTYLYVRGHELFDHLLNSVLNPIISSLRNCHYSTLRSSGIDASSQKAALQEYCKKDKSVKSLLSKNYRYKDNTPIYEKIKVDVSQIWD